MPYAVGILLALSIALLTTWVGFDRDRSFYPVLTILVASFYGLFAVMGGSPALMHECGVALGFIIGAVLGFRRNLWILVGFLAFHGVFDAVHGGLITNPGVPAWWPPFCLAYDVTAAAYLAWRLKRGAISARP